MTAHSQPELFDGRAEGVETAIDCLGETFPDESARRSHYREELRLALAEVRTRLGGVEFTGVVDAAAHLVALERWTFDDDNAEALADRMAQLPAELDLLSRWRNVIGFPDGDEDTIVDLSDPPYYTACPNPFLPEIVSEWRTTGNEAYARTPFAVDVTEGKNDRLYRLPSYHTKVPPAAIQRYLLHYTDPGDLVLDAFCGTGMTGLAGLLLGQEDKRAIQGSGARRVILCDLSPAATFTASVMNAPLPETLSGGRRSPLVRFADTNLSDLYRADFAGKVEEFDYAVWSEWGQCDQCGATFRLFDVMIDSDNDKMKREYPCPECGATISARKQARAFTADFDPWVDEVLSTAKTSLVLLSRRQGNTTERKEAQAADWELHDRIGRQEVGLTPTELPFFHMTHERNNLPKYWGITHVHHFYTRRNYVALDRLAGVEETELRRAALFALLTILENNATRRNRFYVDKRRPNGSPVGPLSNTLYVPNLQVETNVAKKVGDLARQISKVQTRWPRGYSAVSTQSATALANIPSDSVDFVFTDPPFGGNINYSEQNYLAEWWLQVFTNNHEEAITNPVQEKDVPEYHELMRRSFSEYYRVVKPGRWMVVEFHNSSNAIWIAIQRALEEAGWVVGSVSVLDKVHATLHQDHKAAAVNKDLAIAVYKPTDVLAKRLQVEPGTEDLAWEFISTHLKQLPTAVMEGDSLAVLSERQATLLFDRLVAFHVSRGIAVPLSAGDFYTKLAARFPERDGMYFLPEQVAEYDRKRAKVSELKQLDLFVIDEATAIEWVRQELKAKPQSFQELQPEFMQEAQSWAKHEKTVELNEILEQNFLRYDGEGPVPSQIHGYLSTNYKDLRNLEKDDARLIEKAEGRWYVPDPNKQGDLEALRERALLKEFEQYKAGKKKLKEFRTEAVRAGFKAAYDERDYETIVSIAKRLPESVLQEDEKLLMYYDVASMRLD